MRITNRFNLPDAIYNAAKAFGHYGHLPDRISVTQLIQPPQMRRLCFLHDDEIEEDAMDRIWAIFGTAVHVVLDKAAIDNAFTEETLTTECLGWTVTGRPDLYDAGDVLSDYKCTSAYSLILGDKVEWEQQLNLYRILYARHSLYAKKLQIVAILRDWSASKARQGGDYPAQPVQVVNVPMWPMDHAENFLATRVALHQGAMKDEYPPCTPTERWEKPTKWAVYKNQNKRADRVFEAAGDAEGRAMELAAAGQKARIEVRPGESTRCASYCRARPFCLQAMAMPEIPNAESEDAQLTLS